MPLSGASLFANDTPVLSTGMIDFSLARAGRGGTKSH